MKRRCANCLSLLGRAVPASPKNTQWGICTACAQQSSLEAAEKFREVRDAEVVILPKTLPKGYVAEATAYEYRDLLGADYHTQNLGADALDMPWIDRTDLVQHRLRDEYYDRS